MADSGWVPIDATVTVPHVLGLGVGTGAVLGDEGVTPHLMLTLIVNPQGTPLPLMFGLQLDTAVELHRLLGEAIEVLRPPNR